MPSSGAPAGSDWALSPEMESVTLSYQIQNLIEQVDIGGLLCTSLVGGGGGGGEAEL